MERDDNVRKECVCVCVCVCGCVCDWDTLLYSGTEIDRQLLIKNILKRDDSDHQDQKITGPQFFFFKQCFIDF